MRAADRRLSGTTISRHRPFPGGPNAGHSLHFENTSFVLHSVPSGIFRKGTVNIIGNGVVIDPVIFREECQSIESLGIPVQEGLMISKRAHLILPTHRIIDAASEHAKGSLKIGSTLKGIGPTYMDKTGRNGIRWGHPAPGFRNVSNALKSKHIFIFATIRLHLRSGGGEARWMEATDYIRQYRLIDAEYYIHQCLKENKHPGRRRSGRPARY